ncbi:hypothetical protein [Methanosphaera cuniculi]|uniref:hypothetical protein n=1 Tax=Methanosphaera cuniculi TaxID=1077256 RepID=UPI0026EDA958|nr:hypothetical protein [Methanosphaera cuniculi]
MDQKTPDNKVVYHSFNKDDDNLTPTQKEENKKSNFNSEMDVLNEINLNLIRLRNVNKEYLEEIKSKNVTITELLILVLILLVISVILVGIIANVYMNLPLFNLSRYGTYYY